jgi:hypothetical protein
MKPSEAKRVTQGSNEVVKRDILEELKSAMKSYDNTHFDMSTEHSQEQILGVETANFSLNSYLNSALQSRVKTVDTHMIDYLDEEIRQAEQSIADSAYSKPKS